MTPKTALLRFGEGLARLWIVAALASAVFPPLQCLARASQPAGLAAPDLEELQGVEAETGEDPAAARDHFLARRLPAGETLASFPLTARYLRAQEAMRRLPRNRHDTLKSRIGEAATAPGAWESLGPGNLGGRTRALVVDPVRSLILYAAGVDGGVWKTTDGGARWTPLGDLLPSLAVAALALDPGNRQVLYAGTGEGFLNADAVRGAGLFKTVDGGLHWQRLAATATPDFHAVNDLVVSARTRAVYAATGTGVWRSVDAGLTWRRTLDPQVQGGCLDLALRPNRADDVLFAACGTLRQATVYRNPLAQKRASWVAVLREPGMGRTSLAIAPSNPEVVYALASSNLPGPHGNYTQGLLAVFRSTTGGTAGSWTAQVRNTDPALLNTALLSSTRFAFQHTCGSTLPDGWSGRGWYDNVIAVDPADADRVWAGGVDLFRSDDGGRTWGLANYWWAAELGAQGDFAHADQHALVFHPRYNGTSNQILWVAGDGGVYRTANARATVGKGAAAPCDISASAVRWTSLNHGYGVTQFYHGAVFPGGQTYLGGTQDLGTVLGGDAAGPEGWRQILGRDGGFVALDPAHPQTVYAESGFLSLVKSTDGGATFVPATAGISGGAFPYIVPFTLDSRDPQRLWLGGDALWRSDDGAAHWSRASFPIAANGADLASAIAVSPHDDQRVVAGTSQGTIARNDAALSASALTSWPAVRPREGFVSSLTFDPVDPDVVYATYSTFGGPHVWKSADGGSTWRSLDGSGAGALPDLPAHSLAIDPRHPRRLYLGTDLGLFVSLDGGSTWAVEPTGLPYVVTESLVFAPAAPGAPPSPPVLFAFTHGRGAWRRTLPD
jgi:photosystem II stability/assembly factor-like uncharacterized protein